VRILLVCAALAILASPARADSPSYRRELIIVDSISAGTLGAGAAAATWLYSPDDFHLPLTIAAFGGTGLVLGGPIVHLAHGHVLRGALSFGLRILTPAIVDATAVTSAGLDERDPGYDGYFFGGMALGAGIAVALDWWLLVPDERARTDSRTPAPMVTPTARGGVLGVAGVW
jgi:hypothetical protein